MITRRHDSPAHLSEASDAFVVRFSQPVAEVYGKQPEFVKEGGVEPVENVVVTGGIHLAVACGHLAERVAFIDDAQLSREAGISGYRLLLYCATSVLTFGLGLLAFECWRYVKDMLTGLFQ